jgi:hypothetical protein
MFAKSRKHKVKGRTITLVNSTKHKKGIKYHGELAGRIEDKLNTFTLCNNILTTQQVSAALKLNAKVVVTG